MRRPIVAITQGDPQGIGPEVTAKALALGAADGAHVVVLGERSQSEARARAEFVAAPVTGASAALWALEEACRFARAGAVDAIVTAPVHKADLVRAGFTFPGQTEFLGDRLRLPADRAMNPRPDSPPTMLLAGPSLRVALVTTHLRLARVAREVTTARVVETIRRLDAGLRDAYGIPHPRIAVLGLNPHAGEEGLFGPEDDAVVRPAVERCASEGIACRGPLPGDGTFAPRARAAFDGFVAMYHDQGLAALKAVDGGRAVNVTLGLPVPRTSPDHGTARDIAGRGVADPESMVEAIRLAVAWGRRRQPRGDVTPT